MTDIDIQEFLTLHTSYTRRLADLIISIVDGAGIKYHLIESRTKEYVSLKNKIERKKILDIKKEITDLSGVRIILFYQSDIPKIEDLIKENFEIDNENSINKSEILQKNEFGYLSVHYIVKIKEDRSAMIEWKSFVGLNAEIQIRTILQHSWASISHELSYKRENEVPTELSRKLFRLAGLFELADEQFEEIKDKSLSIEAKYKEIRQSKEFSTEPINVFSLKAEFENASSKIKEIVSEGYSTGFSKPESGYDYDDDELSQINLLHHILRIQSFENLYNVLKESGDKQKRTLKRMLDLTDGDWQGSLAFLTIISLLTNLDDEELKIYRDDILWAEDLWEIVKKALKE